MEERKRFIVSDSVGFGDSEAVFERLRSTEQGTIEPSIIVDRETGLTAVFLRGDGRGYPLVPASDQLINMHVFASVLAKQEDQEILYVEEPGGEVWVATSDGKVMPNKYNL